MRIKLIKPTLAHEAELLAYQTVFEEKNISLAGMSSFKGFGGGKDGVAKWLDFINAPEGTLHPTQGFSKVAESVFIAWHLTENRMVGVISIRHHLNEFLLNVGGHIGYSIHPDYWGQGYGTEQLQLGLLESDKLGIQRVLITCNKTNVGSRLVIERSGGVLENEVEQGDRITQRFWIERQS